MTEAIRLEMPHGLLFKDKKDKKSVSFHQAISDLNFIRILALAVFTQKLQKRTLDISTVYPALKTLKSKFLSVWRNQEFRLIFIYFDIISFFKPYSKR